jgi:aminoglycoside phosphotransferase (APT) family kinase protein
VKRPSAGSDPARLDPAIPGLAALLDPEGRRRAMERALEGEVLGSPQVEYARYKPGVSALFLWKAGRPDGGEARVYAKVYAEDRGAAEAGRAAARRREGEPARFALLEVPRAVAYAFPLDAGLAGLRRLLAPDGLKRALSRSRPDRKGAGWRAKARGSALELVRYKPENRAVFRIEARWRRDADGAHERETLYGRTLPEAKGAAVAGIHGALACAADVTVPRLAGFDSDTRTVFVGALSGTPLLESPADPGGFRAAGAALAALHRCDLPLPAAESGAGRVGRLRREYAALERVGEPWAGPALRLLDRIGGNVGTSIAVVHGDFHAEQVLLDGGKAALLDLDGAGAGNPLLDLGSFLGHLRLLVRSGDLTEEQAGSGAEAFLAAYGPRVEGLETVTVLALLDLGLSPLRRLEEGATERVGAVVEEARALLEAPALVRAGIRGDGTIEYEFERRTPIGALRRWEILPPAGERIAQTDPASLGPEGIRTALDPAALSAILRARLPGDAGVVRTNLLSLRPGRRGVVRARLADGATLIVKVYAPGRGRGDWPRASTGPGAPRLPRRLADEPDLGLVFFEDLEGEVLSRRLGKGEAEADVRATARALRIFHGGPPPARRKDLAGELAIAASRHEAACRVGGPGREERADALERLRVLAGEAPAPSSGRLHGDFYEAQVLVGPSGIAFLDLDLSCEGDPALDVGNFLAHLALREAQGNLEPPRAERLRAAFLDGYGPGGPDFEERVPLYQAVSLARLSALQAIRPGSGPMVHEILRRCRESLDCARR